MSASRTVAARKLSPHETWRNIRANRQSTLQRGQHTHTERTEGQTILLTYLSGPCTCTEGWSAIEWLVWLICHHTARGSCVDVRDRAKGLASDTPVLYRYSAACFPIDHAHSSTYKVSLVVQLHVQMLDVSASCHQLRLLRFSLTRHLHIPGFPGQRQEHL